MDRVRVELLPPTLIAEMHRQARRRALADQAAAGGWSGRLLLARVGAMLVHAGCRLVETGQREPTAASSPSLSLAIVCGCAE